MANILIIGCGTIGGQLALQLAAQGHTVTGLKRNPPATASGINYVAADIIAPETLSGLAISPDVVFFIVSADARTEQSYHDIYQLGLANVLAQFPKPPWFFISSTSVYGQTQGEWVDEESDANPVALTAQLIRQAEQRVVAANPDNVVVRFSGLYGAGSLHLLRMARAAPVIQQTPPYFTNRIHQHDATGILAFLLQKRLEGARLQPYYLASDDDPAPLWDVVSWLAQRMGCPPPSAKAQGPVDESNKRCDNRRLKALGYRFRYASYQDGYRGLSQ